MQEVFAITKKRGIDTGGLWHSSDGGEHWEDKTAMLYGRQGVGEGQQDEFICVPHFYQAFCRGQKLEDCPAMHCGRQLAWPVDWRSHHFIYVPGSMPQTEEALSESVDILNIFTPPGNPKDVVLLGTGSFLWVSSDAGATLTARRLPGGLKGAYIRSLKIHPRRVRRGAEDGLQAAGLFSISREDNKGWRCLLFARGGPGNDSPLPDWWTLFGLVVAPSSAVLLTLMLKQAGKARKRIPWQCCKVGKG
eukprot:1157652-Pelagomonas_calceolata.AAC.4